MRRRLIWPALAATLAVQCGIVGIMLYDRIITLRDGREIVIRSTFVDPRDIFRGHYVRLNADVNPPGALLEWDGTGSAPYIALRKGEDGFWIAQSGHANYPETKEPVLRAERIRRIESAPSRIRITLPFDRYFAPELRALELENLRREQRLGIVLALDGKGGGVIKGITVDGERILDEPLL